MAVYEGARPRPGFVPRRSVPAPAGRVILPRRGAETLSLPRRRSRVAIRAGRRANRVGLALGAIVVAFLLGFFSLAQTVRVSASGYDLDQLQTDRARLLAEQRQLRSDLDRLGGEPAVRKLAIDGGLTQLAEPLVVPAR
ncbi:MAG TPA: hypothetical protein VF763_02365 [Candidatus Limnocylindrales bacterium]